VHVTREILLAAGAKFACSDLDAFCAEWSDGCEVTEETVARAVALGLDIDWAAQTLLCAPAREEYERIRDLAWEEYERVTVPAWKEYDRIIARAWKEYERVRGPAREEYERIRVPAWEEYERVTATVFLAACRIHDQRGSRLGDAAEDQP
jgi:hypothetical protein